MADFVSFLRGYYVLLPTPLHGPVNFLTTMSSRLTTVLTSLFSHIQQSPDVASIVLLMILLFVSLKIVNLLYRTIMFWIVLILKIAFYGSLAAIGLWIWSRGIEGVEEDIGNLTQLWKHEYGYWQEKQRLGVQGMYGQRARYNTVVGGGGGHGRWGW